MVKKILWIGAGLILLLLSVILFLPDPNATGTVLSSLHDLDEDGINEEYVLRDHILTVTEGSKVLWTSPKEYQIDSFSLGDADNDGKDNLVISLWKKGSFGKMKPFWHSGEDRSFKNHLFVYRLQNDQLKPVWCSSNLDRPILEFSIGDRDGDGQNELTVEEGTYQKEYGETYKIDPDGPKRTSIWKWEEWGFRLQECLN